MRAENMIDEMSDACYPGHMHFRYQLHARIFTSRSLCITTCHTSSLSDFVPM